MKLSKLVLKSQNIKEAIAYYTKVLGAELISISNKEKEERYLFQFTKGNSAALELRHQKGLDDKNDAYKQEPTDTYWKYSLFVCDILQVYNAIKNNHTIGTPYQFGNIGYLSHTHDIEAYNIEFIQKDFKENTKPSIAQDQYPLKEIPVLGLITLRTKDPLKSIQFYELYFELKLHVRMYVDRGNGVGFTLYFLGGKSLQAPSKDIDAIENREWMYQQNETFIELQYHWGTEHDFELEYNSKEKKRLGFQGIEFTTTNNKKIKEKLSSDNQPISIHKDEINEKEILTVISPDKHPIFISQL